MHVVLEQFIAQGKLVSSEQITAALAANHKLEANLV